MYENRPIIGIAGGIGSGKTFVARLLGELGCVVISSDDLVRRAYERQDVKERLVQWWGEAILDATGRVDRRGVGERIFRDAGSRLWLEGMLHPIVAEEREGLMRSKANDRDTLAFVWDSPLLFETGLDRRCDAVVFVEAPDDLRARRVLESRGWDQAELHRRENLQLPLDKKRLLSDYVIENTADAEDLRDQVRDVLSRILAKNSPGHGGR